MKENNQDFTEIISVEEMQATSKSIVDGMNDSNSLMYTSFDADSAENKIKLYNAASGEGERVKAYLNKPVTMLDCVIMPVKLVGENGEESVVPRTSIITKEGITLNATSFGVYRSLQKINAIFGTLHFEQGLVIVPVEVKTKRGSTVNIKVEKLLG